MKYKENNPIRRLVLAGLVCGLILLMTMVLMVPIPHLAGAYVNLGDVGVYLAAFLLGGPIGAVCAGVGSALADVLLGSVHYAIPTFLIKGLMALLAALFLKRFPQRRFLALLLAGLVMPVGYFLFEALLYGPVAALAGVPANLMQYAACVALGLPVIRIAERMLPKAKPV